MPACDHCGGPATILSFDGGPYFTCEDHVTAKFAPEDERSSMSGPGVKGATPSMMVQDELTMRTRDRFGRACTYIDQHIEKRIRQLAYEDTERAKRKFQSRALPQDIEIHWTPDGQWTSWEHQAPPKAAFKASMISLIVTLAAVAVALSMLASR